MSEKKNPAANGGARTIADAGQAGDAEDTKKTGGGEGDRADPRRASRAVVACPACANPDVAMMFRQATERQVAAAIWFLRALILGREEPRYWLFVSDIWAGALSKDQRNNIAEAVLRKLGPEDLGDLARTLMRYAGWPRAFFLNLMEEARSWAAIEGRETLKAYMLACFEALPTQDRVAFLNYVAERWGLTGTVSGRRPSSKAHPQGAPRVRTSTASRPLAPSHGDA